jgi:hypothetical protein
MKFTQADAGRRFKNVGGEIDRVPDVLPIEGESFKSELGFSYMVGHHYVADRYNFTPVSFVDEPKVEAAPAAEFKLEVGKSYRQRDGEGPIKIMDYNPDARYTFIDHRTIEYKSNGRCYEEFSDHDRDLVALWEEQPTEAQPSPEGMRAQLHSVRDAILEQATDPNLPDGWVEGKGQTIGNGAEVRLAVLAQAKYTELFIAAAAWGGFVIFEEGQDDGMFVPPLAAFSTIEEATAFIAAHLKAEGK